MATLDQTQSRYVRELLFEDLRDAAQDLADQAYEATEGSDLAGASRSDRVVARHGWLVNARRRGDDRRARAPSHRKAGGGVMTLMRELPEVVEIRRAQVAWFGRPVDADEARLLRTVQERAEEEAVLREAADAMREWSKRLPRESEWQGAFAGGIRKTMLNSIGEHESKEGEMARSTLTGSLFRAARLSATGRAVRTGNMPRRVKNLGLGRGIGTLGGWRIWR